VYLLALTTDDVSYRREPYLKKMEQKVSTDDEDKYGLHTYSALKVITAEVGVTRFYVGLII
jgi:hypothetical protein